ncbi:MAG TPA: phospholipase [Pirellulales bacterium]|nr:phospholipase [Pirellulales bacterium]
MSATAGVLRELHRIHRQLGDLRERLDRGPKQIKARQGSVTKLEAELAQAKAETKAARVGADQKQLLLKSGEAKIRDLKAKLNAASSNREYQALKDQIAADEMANSVLADEILEALEKIDGFAATIGEAEQNLAKGREELTKVEHQVREQHDRLIADVQRLESELKTVEVGLPPDFRDAYQRVVKGKGSDAMAQVEGETCGGCYHRLTSNIVSSLLMDHLVTCQSCGRMLYLPEDRTPGGK